MTEPSVGNDSRGDPGSAAFELLSDPRRRVLVRSFLRAESAVVDVDVLVDRLVTEADDLDREAAATELRHVHLPKLVDEGIIEYDPRDDLVRVDPPILTDRLHRTRSIISELSSLATNRN